MIKRFMQYLMIMAALLIGSSVQAQGLGGSIDVSVDPANGLRIRTPTVGRLASRVMRAFGGPTVYWHTGGRDYGLAPGTFDLETMRETNGRYRRYIKLSIVPRGITRAISVTPIDHSDMVRGPSRKSGWAWRTPNYYDGAWRGYTLRVEYRNSNQVDEFEYWVLSSPNPAITEP